jgi:hypothetical protein
MLAITNKKITKIKVAEWGTPKKYLKKILLIILQKLIFHNDVDVLKEKREREKFSHFLVRVDADVHMLRSPLNPCGRGRIHLSSKLPEASTASARS